MSRFHTLFRCCFSEPGLAHVEGIMANPSSKSHEQRGQDLVSPCPVTPSLKAPAGPPRDLTLMDHSQAAAPACPPSQTAPWESLLMEALPFSLAVVNSDGMEVQHQILGSEPAAAQVLRQALQQSRHSASTAAEGVQVLVNKQGRSQERSKHMTAEDLRQTATHASSSACSFLAEDTQGSQERSHQSKHMTAEDTHQAAAHASSSVCSFLAALLGPDMADDALSTVHKGRSWKGSIVMRLPCGPPSSSCGPPSSSSQGSLQSGAHVKKPAEGMTGAAAAGVAGVDEVPSKSASNACETKGILRAGSGQKGAEPNDPLGSLDGNLRQPSSCKGVRWSAPQAEPDPSFQNEQHEEDLFMLSNHSRDPHELTQPRGLGGLHTEMEAQTLPDMSSLASTGTAIGAISATSFAVTSPAHCCDSLEGFGRHSEATGTADVPRRPRSKSCSIRRRSRGSRISLLKTEKEIEQLMLGSGDTGNNRTIAFLRSLSRQVETADASGSQQSHLERAGSGHGGSRASQDALGFSHPSVPDVDHLCVSMRASEETQDELEEPVPWSFDIFVTLLKPGEHERSPLVVLISNSTQHLQVQSTLSALAESQLELLSSLMPQHAVQFLALESTEAVPRHVAELARAHKGVTLLFMDIVGFTSMSKNVEPVDVMVFLNTLFSVFDQLTDIHGVHKVETAGDCYIVSGGIMSSSKQSTKEFGLVVEDQDPKESAMRVMGFAKAILDAAQQVKMPDTQEPVRVRVGMHTGDVVSGLIGSKLPKFSIFGDTMNTCSRMESTGLPGRIHVSETTHNLLCESELWEPTGGVEVKGKGMMQTFLWVPPSPGLPSSNQMLQPIFEETSAESLPSVLIKQTNALLNQLHMPVPAFHPTSQDLPHTESLLPWLNCLSERVVELGYPVSK